MKVSNNEVWYIQFHLTPIHILFLKKSRALSKHTNKYLPEKGKKYYLIIGNVFHIAYLLTCVESNEL